MVLTLEYKDEFWDIKLPTVRAYQFNPKEIADFIQKENEHPLVFDTNLTGACNTNCIYCSTMGGKYDIRYPLERAYPFVKDDQYEEVIKQLPALGVRTFFICSNGEPLLNPERFIKLARKAYENDLRIITYTNGTTLSEKVLEELEKIDVNIVMKLESLNSEKNDNIVLNEGKKRKSSFGGYKYVKFKGQIVPDFIPRALEVYGKDVSRLGLETMIVSDNHEEVCNIREWVHGDLEIAQFLKHLYPLGYIQLSGKSLELNGSMKSRIDENIKNIDERRGFKYPTFYTPDHFSFDARRLMNNIASRNGFPFRIFGHERCGVYHSSQMILKRIGFGTDKIIGIFNDKGEVDIKRYFSEISSQIGKNDVWRPNSG